MSTSSDGPADPADVVPVGPGETAPLPPPGPSPTPSPGPSRTPTLAPELTESLENSTAPTLTASHTATLAPALPESAAPLPIESSANSAAQSLAPVGTRLGDLTPRWRYVLAAAWVVAFFAYAATWQASVQIGVGTWWVGPRAQPTRTIIKVLPSLLSITMAMCAIYNVPRLVRLSAVGVLLATIIAIPDFTRSIGLGVTELIIAGMLGLVTVAAVSGRYRLAPDHSHGEPESDGDTPDAAPDATDNAASPAHNGAGDSTDTDATTALFSPPDQTGP